VLGHRRSSVAGGIARTPNCKRPFAGNRRDPEPKAPGARPSGGPPPPPQAHRHGGATARPRDAPGRDQPDVRRTKPHRSRRSCSPAAPATATSSAAVSTCDPWPTWSPAGRPVRDPDHRRDVGHHPCEPSRRRTGAPPNRARHAHKPEESLNVADTGACNFDASRQGRRGERAGDRGGLTPMCLAVIRFSRADEQNGSVPFDRSPRRMGAGERPWTPRYARPLVSPRWSPLGRSPLGRSALG
jgi:hypothetical protein